MIRFLPVMADPLLTFQRVEHRHTVTRPTPWRPWAKGQGAGIVGLDLDLYAGSVLGLVGPNGAGKTTLLRMMAGVLPIQKGTVVGHAGSSQQVDVVDLRTWAGHMPEQVRWQGRITVRQVLEQLSEMRGAGTQQLDGLLNLVGLRQRAEDDLDNLSQGMRQRLSIAVALLGSPKVLLLDEPFNGLDPVASEAFASLVRRLASKGVCIVISSHMVTQLEGLIDRIALLHRGQLLDEGPLADVERRLDLDGRYVVHGRGAIEPEKVLADVDTDILAHEEQDGTWSITVRGAHDAVLDACRKASLDIVSWSPARPNLVEWLCAATGMTLDDVSLEVTSAAFLPMRSAEVTEDE